MEREELPNPKRRQVLLILNTEGMSHVLGKSWHTRIGRSKLKSHRDWRLEDPN
jgi:hypothetical protein